MHVLQSVTLVNDDVTPRGVTKRRTIVHRDFVRRHEYGTSSAWRRETIDLLDVTETFTNHFALFLVAVV